MSSAAEEIEKAATACIDGGHSALASRKYLQLVRENKVRQSERVATFGSELLQRHRGKIPQDELWVVMEQVAEAALDVRALDLAFTIIQEIRKKFPDTQRVQRIMAMYFESKGKYKEAEDLTTKMLEEHPDSHFAFKRQVAAEKTKGNTGKAIDLLRTYVDTFMTDRDAWAELADLYLEVQAYPQAAHCYEEVLLHSPQSIPLYVRYADVLYTMGGSNLKTARQYYAAALKLSNGEDTRALYGICCTAAALSAQKGKVSKEEEDLNKAAAQLLQKKYGEDNNQHLPLVKELLRMQGLS